MTSLPLVSVLINNYNYGRFLGEAIDSALAQTYPRVEVVVVDDGSTDDSRAIIAGYGDRVVPVLKENGGQASAINAGFAASRGEIICFLDSDDVFYPDKVAAVVQTLVARGKLGTDALVWHLVELIDASAQTIKARHTPSGPWWEGNYCEFAERNRYVPYPALRPSGAAATRSLAERIMPLPEGFPSGGDDFFMSAAGVVGEVCSLDAVLTKYRCHGNNYWYGKKGHKPREFYEARTHFVNQKLVEIGRRPVVSFFDSKQSLTFYRYHRRNGDLLRLALVVPAYRLGYDTIKFSIKTLCIVFADAGRASLTRLMPGQPEEDQHDRSAARQRAHQQPQLRAVPGRGDRQRAGPDLPAGRGGGR